MLPRKENKESIMHPDSYLTVKQVAQHLNVSPSVVYQLLDSGRLACHRIGKGRGTIRVSAGDLLRERPPRNSAHGHNPPTDSGEEAELLLKKNADGSMSADERGELEEYERLEHLGRMLKARLRQKKNS